MRSESLSTPVLFIIFNRLNTTRRVFDVIRKVKPSRLYIAADGPRKDQPNDESKVQAVRQYVLSHIDWECEVKTLWREGNLGCKCAVSKAVTWFFEQEEYGIILEDDVLPDSSFFGYCAQLLELYKNDKQVMHISGLNVCGKWKEKVQSYHGSYFGNVWGWASWRRAWKFYDVGISEWSDPKIRERVLQDYFPEEMRVQRKQLYDDLYNGLINTWDYQWTFCRLLQGGISLIPSVNLVENLGFDQDAVHTSDRPYWMPDRKFSIKLPLIKGDCAIDREYDNIHNSYAFGKKVKQRTLWTRIWQFIKRT